MIPIKTIVSHMIKKIISNAQINVPHTATNARMENHLANQIVQITQNILNVSQIVLNLESKTHRNVSKTRNALKSVMHNVASIGKVYKYFTYR